MTPPRFEDAEESEADEQEPEDEDADQAAERERRHVPLAARQLLEAIR